MQLKFKKAKVGFYNNTSSIYGRTNLELKKAVSQAVSKIFLNDPYIPSGDFQKLVRLVLDAFDRGMTKGYNGYPSDDASASSGCYRVDAYPQNGVFEIFKRLG